ncbi:MAG: ATP-binding protein [Pseudomonadota bacterium]
MKNRILGWLIAAIALAMALVAVMVVYAMLSEQESHAERFDAPVTQYAAQVDYKLLVLMDHVDRFGAADPEVSRADVLARIELLRSWIDTDGRAGRTARYLELDGAGDMLKRLGSELELLESEIGTLQRGDHETAHVLKEGFRGLLAETHRVAIEAIAYDAAVEERYRMHHAWQVRLTLGLIAGTLIFGFLSIFRFWSGQREVEAAASSLEARIAERTRDLEHAKTELEAQIRNREQDAKELQERGERLTQAARLAKLGYYIWDAVEEKCEYCSEQHARTHGVSPEEFLKRSSNNMTFVHPDDADLVREKLREVRNGNIVIFDHRVNTPNGVNHVREIVRPIFDDAGRVVKEIASSIDITENYITERKLQQAQRLESLGKLTGGVAHDFNNLLAVALGNLDILRRGETDSLKIELLDDALSAVYRGRDLTRTMLAFARRAHLEPKPLNLNSVVQSLEGMIRRLLPATISFETSLAASPWNVAVDRSAIESAIVNLVVNAKDAMADGGSLTIEVSNMRIDDDYIRTRGEDVEPGRYVLLAVTDTGEGIAGNDLEKIYEPFFSTKDLATNSGLGLSMVEGFVRQSNGVLRVYSEPGVGTTFKMYFPSSDPAGARETAVDRSEEIENDRVGARLLLVEDDELVRRTLMRQLLKEGFHVVEAQDSASAEQAFKTKGPFDALITDIVMPGDLQGPALAKRLRGFDSELGVIFMSGYPQEAAVHGNGLRPEDLRLMKPVARSELLQAIGRILN